MDYCWVEEARELKARWIMNATGLSIQRVSPLLSSGEINTRQTA